MSGPNDQDARSRPSHAPFDFRRARSRLWLTILAIAVLTAIWMRLGNLTLDGMSAVPAVLSCAGLELAATFYITRRPEPAFAATLSGLALAIAFSASAGPLSYAAAATGGPLWDRTFHALDRSLGLDWVAYLRFLNDHPGLGSALSLAYRSLIPQIILVVVILGLSGRGRAVWEFLLAFVIAGLVTILISGLVPALGTFTHFELEPKDFPALNPAVAYLHLDHLANLRNGTLHTISLTQSKGIITFPSFHAALGVLFAHALWQWRVTRWPGLGLNAMLVAATPIDGGHYFVDVGAGILIAVAAIAVARIAGRRIEAASAPAPGAGLLGAAAA